MSRILCLWLPNWPIQRLRAAAPELEDRPIVLIEPSSRGAQRVAACCCRARALGIEVGMPAAEISTKCEVRSTNKASAAEVRPSPVIHRTTNDPLADRSALLELAHWCERFSPIVGLEEAAEPEGLLLDVVGLASLFGGERQLVDRAVREVRRRGYQPRAALADTIGAAWALVRHAGGEAPVFVPPGETPAALAPLPIEALRLSEAIVDVLDQLGIHTIGQLTTLPRESLRSRFGPELLDRLDQASGVAEEVIVAVNPPPEFSAEWLLEYPTDDLQVIGRVIEVLAGRVADSLAERRRGALWLVCRLVYEQMETLARPPLILEVGLFRASAMADHWLALLRLEMERRTLAGPVESVQLQATRSGPLVERQQRLFATDKSAAGESTQLAGLIDRLAGRLGHRAVIRPRLVRDAQPELAYRGELLVGERPRRAAQAPPSVFQPLERPLCLFRRPVPIDVVALAPHGPPAHFTWHATPHIVARHAGPERIETGWWRRQGIRRDYWRIETHEGDRYWLFRDLRSGHWFLHGQFH